MLLSPSASAIAIGLTIFVVAGYQAVTWKEISVIKQQEFERVPVHVTFEVILAFGLCLWGSLGLAGSFKLISPFANQKGLDAHAHRPDFLSFGHRGQITPLDIPPLEGAL